MMAVLPIDQMIVLKAWNCVPMKIKLLKQFTQPQAELLLIDVYARYLNLLQLAQHRL